MINPFEGFKITSPYGMRKDPFDGTQKKHTGCDLVKGDKAPLFAFMSGEVVHAKLGEVGSGFGNFGNVVALKDVNGSIQFYAHLDSFSVKVGDKVKVGQEVGKQGNTGHSAGSHLHFEVRLKSTPSFGFGTDTEPTAYLQKYMGVSEVVSKPVEKVIPKVVKERIFVQNGKLVRCDGNYRIKATDVRYIKFDKGTYTLKLVWAKGKTITQIMKDNPDASYGFNFPFFGDSSPIADCKIGDKILGTGYDKPNGANMTKWHGFAWKNGEAVIGMMDIKDDYGKDGFLVKTTPLLINNGHMCWEYYRAQDGTASDIGKNGSTYVSKRRTIVGLDTNGNLHLAVADGETAQWDKGLTLEEEALYMESKSCITVLNGDGGGSSQLNDRTGSLGQNKGNSERAVNHAVLVFLNK